MRLRLLVPAAILLASPPLHAATINVPAGDVPALVAAIATANASGEDDTIVLAAGSTYALTAVDNGVTGLPVVSGKLTIQGNGATIERTGVPEFRILDVADNGDLSLDGVTVKGGKVTFLSAPPPFFRDGGAGIRVVGAGKLTLTNSVVTQNTCTGPACFGGGIMANDDDTPVLTLVDSEVSENFAENGGGICLNHNNQTLNLTRTVVRGNTGIEGGGIGTYGADTITITDSTIIGNAVTSTGQFGGALGGGILDVSGATWTISGTTITGNSASGTNTSTASTNIYGGGMAENGGATITIVNSTITGNSLTNTAGGLIGGAGLFSEGGGTWTLNNVTVAGNTISGSNGSGGGMEATRGIFTLRNSIVHGNTAARNPDCSALGSNISGPVFDSFIRTTGHNLVGDTTGCAGFVAATGDLVGSNPMLGPLADNGGLTQTMAIPAGSPAADAGDPGAPGSETGCEATDQRGVARPQGSGCDIGAFEIGAVGPTTTTSTTLPGGCEPRVATFVNIDCRLDLLVAAVQSAQDLGRLKKSIQGTATKARTKKIQAEGHAEAGRAKQARNALKKAIRRMTSLVHKLRGRPARKIIPGPTRDALTGQATPIEDDMRSLLTSLP